MSKEWTCAGCGRADCEHPDCDTCAHAEAKRLRAENATLQARAEEATALLRRVAKYVVEDRAITRGSTRLARVTDEITSWLEAE